MKFFSDIVFGVVMVTALVVPTILLVPQGNAHDCRGKGTITTREVQKGEYLYFQNGQVCGRHVA
jgi:hypothetical protein